MFAYENLEVYNKAYRANRKVYSLIKENRTISSYVKNQLGKASLSIMLNIAEGTAKFSNRDRRNFYVMARGSAFECSSLISFCHEEKEIETPIRDILYHSYEEISRMLFVMIRNLSKPE